MFSKQERSTPFPNIQKTKKTFIATYTFICRNEANKRSMIGFRIISIQRKANNDLNCQSRRCESSITYLV